MSEANKLINHVRSLSSDFVGDDMPVNIDYDSINTLSETMMSDGKMHYDMDDGLSQSETVLVELFASAINYCFWYGKYDIRPVGSSSNSMYDVIINAIHNNFEGFVEPEFISTILDGLVFNRYPLIEERTKHLLEVSFGTQEFIMFVLMNRDNDVRIILHELVRRYPGFASDMFLKRAFLFVLQLNRKLNFFKNIDIIPVPADYQVPKMLECYGCLKYSKVLNNKIKSHTMITRYSIEEISIRAGTVLACDKLSELTDWTKSEIDSWLWLRRKEYDKPFHLTITTDY